MSNIDEKAKNNFTIEMRIFENYEKVKYEIIKVIDFLRHAETNLGMCRIFDNQNHEFWHSVIKPWFQPERFGITHLWFPERFSYMGYGEYHIIRGNRWMKTPIDKIDKEILDIILWMFYSLASLCVVSWYALNVCVGKNFSVCSRLF